MKKIILTAIIIAAMTVSLVACGSSATEETTVATETSEVVETTETTETVESSVEAETETTEEVVETETTATVEETESPAAETGKKAETKTATEKTTDNVTEKQQAASNDVQPSSDNGGGSTSASASSSPQTLNELLAYGAERGWYPMPYYEDYGDYIVAYYFAGTDGTSPATLANGGNVLSGSDIEFLYGGSGSGPVIIKATLHQDFSTLPSN